MKFEIDTLGIIRSPYKEKFAIPRQPGLVKSARARLELLPLTISRMCCAASSSSPICG